MAAPARGAARGGSEYSCFSREAISLVCEAVPGAKGATRRRKVYVVVGAGYWRQGKALQGIAGGTSIPQAGKAQVLRLWALS